jgi:hypothetical protein
VKQVAENDWRVEENAECFTSLTRCSDGKKMLKVQTFLGYTDLVQSSSWS